MIDMTDKTDVPEAIWHDIKDRERKFPIAQQCQDCPESCKVHVIPGVKFFCFKKTMSLIKSSLDKW